MAKLQLVGAAALLGSSIAAASFNPESRGDLATTTNTERFRGALAGCHAPTYDGPVAWVRQDPEQKWEAGIMFGIGGAVGVLAFTSLAFGVPRTD